MSVSSLAFNRVQGAGNKASRILFIDNLRIAVITLVILHHISVIYGANTPFYYVEPHDALATIVLVIFQLFNQAWFMGAFFFLSGYFSPGSFDRKGTGLFLKDRLIRLGIPLAFFYFVLSPITDIIGVNAMPLSLTHLTAPLSWANFYKFFGIGPLWFALMLIAFDFGYAGWRWLTRNWTSQPKYETNPPGLLKIGGFILILAAASYLIRIPWPLGTYVASFPSLAYLPQYLTFFCLGIIAARGNWLRTLPSSTGKWGFVTAVAATAILFPIALTGLSTKFSGNFLGNGTWESAVYVLWDSTFSVGLVLAAVTFFSRFFDHQARMAKSMSQSSFTVYIFHATILVFLAIAIRSVNLEGLLKFVLLAVIAIPVCFTAAYLIRKIPFVTRVL